ncbi:hypothetical protein FE257_005520 [Aspergillus nanangensis]|uniref:Nucleoside phosphorylase domain-containing protein n=1 Tax=Aspergillus nanangensis TaxID=2582783 RepID=A0AAD4CB87_ASPNN|nr:hypothetical protein FE257_005520 [Aspergillus nanangensis]
MTRPPPPRHRHEFGIAIICALGLESDAVEILFDHFWDEGFGKAPGDQNSYRAGVIGKHNVVLAYMPQMGKGPAATVSAHLRSSFENINLALLVGVCGGVPEGAYSSIFLGDIVISESITNYDYGRRLPDGFVSKEPAWTPNFRVTSFLRLLRGWKGRRDLERRMRHHHDVLQGRDNKYGQPQTRRDRLFASSYRHKHYHPQSCIACSTDQPCKEAQDSTCNELKCDPDQCIKRSRPNPSKLSLEDLDQQINIHFGGVASGDTVMKSGEDRDITAKQHDAIAFEMEGAGVYPSLQCIIVKGVCDYADSHKEKSWQPFAAGIAAACMKAMLEQLDTSPGTVHPESYRISPSPQAFDSTRDTELDSPVVPGGSSRPNIPEEGPEGGTGENKGYANSRKYIAILKELHTAENCFRQTLSTLRQCKRSLPHDTDLRRMLKAQRARFRSDIEILLARSTGSPDDAQSMATDCNHQGWQSKDVGTSICSHLGSASEFCLKVVLEIQKTLSMIERLAVRLKEDNAGSRARTCDQNNLDKFKGSLDDLGSLIRVFSSRIPEYGEPILEIEPPVPTTSVVAIEHFRIVQQAANSLYDALGKSCTEHPLHKVHLSLQPRLNGTSTQVDFSVALGSLNTDSSQHTQSMWINVESIMKTTRSSTQISSRSYPVTETMGGKHPSDEYGRSPTSKRKRARLHSLSKSTLPSLSMTLRLDVPHLFLQQNLCSVVHRQLHAQLTLCNNYIGILDDNAVYRHLIYINPHTEKASTSASLSELMLLSKTNSTKSLGLYDRVRLAKYLATAVLYYHTSPWLNRHWRSKDVRFFGKEEDAAQLFRSPEALPYISACVQVPNPERGNHVPSEYDLIIRNPVVFGLGVMLLELAYQAPFDNLKQGIDFGQGTVSFPNYVAAKRLAGDVNVHISASFKKIVKKCLDCDFGYDTDFQSPALQDAFYYQVIGGLEEIEKKLQQLQLVE